MFCAYSREAGPGICDGTLRPPHTWALPIRTTSPATEPSTLPPVSAARSTTTEPGFICSTIADVTSIGAVRPGTAAVVISASAFAMYGVSRSRWRAARSSVISRAYPPAPSSVSSSRSIDLAPIDRISSAAAARTS